MPALVPPRFDAPIGRTADGQPVLGERAFLDYIAQQVFLRIGGTEAPTNADLALGLGDMDVRPAAAYDAPLPPADDALAAARLAALEAHVETLRALINDIRQGSIA